MFCGIRLRAISQEVLMNFITILGNYIFISVSTSRRGQWIHDDVIKWKQIRVAGHLCGEFTGPRWIPPQRPVTRCFDVFFDLHPNNRLSKQWWGWWFVTPSFPFWRHRNVKMFTNITHGPHVHQRHWPAHTGRIRYFAEIVTRLHMW